MWKNNKAGVMLMFGKKIKIGFFFTSIILLVCSCATIQMGPRLGSLAEMTIEEGNSAVKILLLTGPSLAQPIWDHPALPFQYQKTFTDGFLFIRMPDNNNFLKWCVLEHAFQQKKIFYSGCPDVSGLLTCFV